MRVCGVEIKSNEAILCLMELNGDLFDIPDCRQIRFQLVHDQDAESVQKFQFSLKKLFQDYKVNAVAIKERPQKGKFAGGAVGFKIEAALQLISEVETHLVSGTMFKETLKRNPLPVEFKATGLKGFQETAFMTAYAFLLRTKFDR